MSLADEFRQELDRIHDRLGLGNSERVAPVQEPPTEQFERQVLNTGYVFLLLEWVERLVAEIDQLRATIDAGEQSGD